MKVSAIIVTFNRKPLLERCLKAIFNGSLTPNEVIVVNNNSTDDTKSFLEAIQDQYPLSVINHDQNLGSAGGFNSGLKKFIEGDNDFAWIMDDDGSPSKSCLKELLNNADQESIIGPVIHSEENNQKTAFPYLSNNKTTFIASEVQFGKNVSPVHPFNGVLISRNIISKIGYPDTRYFIWGDEVEYRERWLGACFQETVILTATFFHPCDRLRLFRFSRLSLGYPKNIKEFQRFCYYRNRLHLLLKHRGGLRFTIAVIFTLPEILYKFDLRLFISALFDAVSNKMNGHKAYL